MANDTAYRIPQQPPLGAALPPPRDASGPHLGKRVLHVALALLGEDGDDLHARGLPGGDGVGKGQVGLHSGGV